MARNIEKYQQFMKDNRIDALLLKSKTLKKHLATINGSGVLILLLQNTQFLIVDGRYIVEAKEKEKDFQIVLNTPAASKKSHYDIVLELLHQNNCQTLGIEVAGFTITDVKKIEAKNINVLYLDSEIDQIRMIKEDQEIDILKEACKRTDEVFKQVLKHIKVGITENEICAWLHYYAFTMGASRMSFDPVVTSGPRTALPHGRPTERKVQKQEPIMIDFGIEYQGYQSDMTRMVFVGEPTTEMKNIYEVVKVAQAMGIAYIKAGKTGQQVDYHVRSYIEDKGYGAYFDHGLGHGIGVGDGREYPYLNQTSTTILEENMVMSIELGIYIPGVGGVRIEDAIVIKNSIALTINTTTKEYIILEETNET